MTEEEVDRATEQLEFMLYTEKKFVTALTLARHADVHSKVATKVMADFYSKVSEEQRRKSGLYGVYLITGERTGRDDSHRDATILVREEDLEKTKETFSTIDECTLFSLQCQRLDELHKLFCGDIIDNIDFIDRDFERLGIVHVDPLRYGPGGSFEDWKREQLKNRPTTFDILKARAAGVPMHEVEKFKAKQEEKQKKKEAAEHERLEALFQAAAAREKTPKNSPKKLPASPFSTGKKSEKEDEASNSPIIQRKRQRKIMLDGENGEEEETASPKESQAKKRKEEERKKKEKKRAVIESDDELFDKADDSPVKKDIKEEEMEVDEVEEPKSRKRGRKQEDKKEKTKTLEETGALRRSPRKQQPASSSSGTTKRFVQKEINYVDEDGMMCTRREMVEVEVSEEELKKEKEREEARRPLEANKKTNVPQPATKTSAKGAAGAKKPAVGQSKISNFFTKK